MLSAYIPQDRRHALAYGHELPRQTMGAALFADISGFTPLTEALTRTLGSRRGAEELATQLNRVYGALIAEVERFGGSVIDFSGDAITCWFDEAVDYSNKRSDSPGASARAMACALAMHGALAGLGTVSLPSGGVVLLAMKIGVASGSAQRFTVGDPAIQLLDVLAGETLDRMAAAEHIAHRAEIVLSPECYAALGERALIVEWRSALIGKHEERYPVVGGLLTPVATQPWPELPPDALDDIQLRPWLLPDIYNRYQAGGGEPPPELRPVTALFLGFSGIDYEHDPTAEARLDSFVRWVQSVTARHSGSLIQLTIGDKGCYMFITFGAFTAREDDARHAVAAALELRVPEPELGISGVKIGISQGIMCSGAYGSRSRRAYGALGDETNLAARLMQAADPDQVLASGRIQQALAKTFRWELLPSILVKGKRTPVPAARLIGVSATPASAASYTGTLFGRDNEVTWLRQRLLPVLQGNFGGVVLICGEAGAGKSRLVFELRRELAREHTLRWLVCLAEELTRQPLRVFRSLLRAYFAQDAALTAAEARERFDSILDTLIADVRQRGGHESAVELERTRPFLAALIDLRSGGSAYEIANPSQRLAASLAALKTLLSAESLCQPVVLHIEDAHALDETSRTLINLLACGAQGHPFVVLLTSRYHDDGRRMTLNLDAEVPFQTLDLRPLGASDIRALSEALLGGTCGDDLGALLAEKTSGNALFAEQLTLDLRERGALVRDTEGCWQLDRLATIEMPTTVTGVLIARLDRLAMPLRSVAQTAAVLGQEFDMRVLARMCGYQSDVATQLWHGHEEGIWLAVDEQRWRFHHALLRDAAYDMQLRVRLRELHRQATLAIEQVYGEALATQVADLVHHSRQAEDTAREGHYLTLLAEQAYDSSHFREAIISIERALALLTVSGSAFPQRARLCYRLARAHLQLGDESTAELRLIESLDAAEVAGDSLTGADAAYALGDLAYRHVAFIKALAYVDRSLELYRSAGDHSGEGRALNQLGGIYIALAEEEKALACFEQALALPRGSGGRRR